MKTTTCAVMALALCVPAAAQNLLNGSFETTVVTTATYVPPLPAAAGYWLGDNSAIVPARDGITPHGGGQMLQFRYADIYSFASPAGSCEVFQLVDLSAYGSLISTGNAVARAGAVLNRVAGDSQTDTGMYLRLMAYAGHPSTFPAQHLGGELADEIDVVWTDAAIATWESAAIDMPLPAATGFVAVKLGASETVYNDITGVEFDGHYADAVTLEIVPEPAAPALLALGGLAALRRRRR